jgi:hypothetical protein
VNSTSFEDGHMLKSLFKKKNEGPTPEEILAISAARSALVGRVESLMGTAANSDAATSFGQACSRAA